MAEDTHHAEEKSSLPTPQERNKTSDANTGNKTKRRSTIEELIRSIKPALILENVFGIFRFSLSENGITPVKTKNKVFGILQASFIVILFSCFLQIPNAIPATGVLVDLVDDVPSIVVLIHYVSAVITTLFFLSEPTIKIIRTFVELDTTLRINSNELFYRKCQSKTTRYLILLITIHIIFTVLDISTDEVFEYSKPISTTLYLVQDLEIFVFCKMVLMLKYRLQIINEYLGKFVLEKDINKTPIFIVNEKETTSDKNFNFIGRISPNNMKIRELASMYDTIGNTCYLINEVFKFQIFMNLVSTFTFIVITIWTSLLHFRTPESASGPLVTAFLWCTLTIVSVAIMSFTCESLLTTRNSTKLLVNEIIMDYDLPKIMRVQAKVFMELIEAWPLRIFVYDMFSVDIKLMLKFVSVATTYLIVIIQISHFV